MAVSQGYKQLGIDVNATSTTAQHALGTIITGTDGRFYRYVVANAAIAVGDALIRTTSGTGVPYRLTPATAVNQSIAGVAPVAIASGSYGWVVVRGDCTVKVAGSTAAGTQVGTSATAGTLSGITISGSPTQAEIQRVLAAAAGIGIQTTGAESGGLATAVLT